MKKGTERGHFLPKRWASKTSVLGSAPALDAHSRRVLALALEDPRNSRLVKTATNRLKDEQYDKAIETALKNPRHIRLTAGARARAATQRRLLEHLAIPRRELRKGLLYARDCSTFWNICARARDLSSQMGAH